MGCFLTSSSSIPHLMKITGIIILLFSLLSCTQDANPVIQLEKANAQIEVFAPEIISTFLHERDMAIHPSGNEIIYTIGNQKQSKRGLVSFYKKNGNWAGPEMLNISGLYQDIEPFYFKGGDRLYFASNRPLAGETEAGETEAGDYNLWYSDRSETGWNIPIALGSEINTEGDEFYPSLSANGNLYFTASRGDGIGREDIFVSKYLSGIYQAPAVLDSNINSIYFEFNAYIHPDEDLIIFSSFGRSDGLGGGDLYYSLKGPDGIWAPSKNMGERINSEQLDYCPFVDVVNRTLYFTSERYINEDGALTVESLNKAGQLYGNGFGDIYRISLEAAIKAR